MAEQIGRSTELVGEIAAKWALIESRQRGLVEAKALEFRNLVQSTPDVFALAENMHDSLKTNPETAMYGVYDSLRTFAVIAPELEPLLSNARHALDCIGLLIVIDCVRGFEEELSKSDSRKTGSFLAAITKVAAEEQKASLGGSYLLALCGALAQSNGNDAVAVNDLIGMNWGGSATRVENALETVGIREKVTIPWSGTSFD